MGGKRLIHGKKDFSIVYLIEKFWDNGKKYMGDLIVGVVIGLIVLIVTPLVNAMIESNEAQRNLVNNLSSISLGMSKNYIDGLFGQPIVESEYEKLITWYENHQTEETLITAGYKLSDSVLLCLYCNKTLEAYVVVVNKEHLYRIPANMYLSDCYLLDFTYADFYKTFIKCEGNVPANNDDYAYYFELFGGGGPSDFNDIILGSYKDYRDGTGAYSLGHIGQEYMCGLDLYDAEEHRAAREKTQPNVFGMVSSAFSDEFNFVFQIVRTRTNGSLLFDDWI